MSRLHEKTQQAGLGDGSEGSGGVGGTKVRSWLFWSLLAGGVLLTSHLHPSFPITAHFRYAPDTIRRLSTSLRLNRRA